MPAVPVYVEPQVDVRPLGAPNVDSVASPTLLGGAAQQRMEFAKGLLTAGAGVSQVAHTMQVREDGDAVMRAEATLKDAWIKYQQETQEHRQGAAAKGVTADTGRWFDEHIRIARNSLNNDTQQQLFARRALSLRSQGTALFSSYEVAQRNKSHDDAWAANKSLTISAAAAAATPAAIDAARLQLENLNKYQATLRGWEPDQLQAEILKDKTRLHRQVLEQLAQVNPAQAQRYWDTFKDEVDGSLHAEMAQFAKRSTATSLGESVAAAVWGEIGPKSDASPLELDRMEAALRNRLGDNEFAVKAGIAALRERTAAFDKGAKERQDLAESEVWKASRVMTLAQVQRLPQFLALPGAKQNQVLEHMENRAWTLKERRRADEIHAQQDAERSRNFAAYAVYSNPENLAGMSEAQIINLQPHLGVHLTDRLLEKKRTMDRGGKVIEAKMDRDDFNHVAQEVGLRPFDPKKDEHKRAALGELQYRIENIIDAEQQRLKRALTREEKMVVFRREMDNKVIVDNFDFGTGLRDAPKATILLSPEELKTAYVMVEGKRVNLASIPPADRAEIIRGRQARGLPVTEQKIAETWLAAQKRAKPRSGATASY